jgi:processive 1,2-diacylglycerol beta-glucosyltransferase
MKKVLIVSVRAGAGHVKVAEALEKMFKIEHPDFEVKNIDLLDHSSALIKYIYGQGYLNMVKAIPELYAYSYKHYESAKNFVKPRLLLDKINFKDLFDVVDEFNPDLIIATHFIPGAIFAKSQNRQKYKLVVTLTDYEFHPLWLIDDVDLFSVATEEMEDTLIFYGVDEGKIIVSGIPISPQFSEQKNKEELRKKFDLSSQSPVVLISAGSFGITPLENVVDEFKKIKSDFQMMVVCGNNEKLKKQLEDRMANETRLKKVFGFVDFMDELMVASDIMVTKPGGITVSESLAVGLPMIFIEPIPGQEEANADYLLEEGAAVKARDLPA